MEMIADEAGVAVQTIYNSIGSKGRVLSRLLDVTVAGDDRDIPLAERIGRRIHDEPDPRRIVTLLAGHFVSVFERMALVNHILWSAAASDPEVGALWETNKRQRLWGYTQAAKELRARDGLRPGLTVDGAAAIIWTIGMPETYRFLVEEQGWPADRYRRWVDAALAAALLPTA